jgi:hypothetical protein
MFDTVTFRLPIKNPCLNAFADKGGRYVFNPPPLNGYALPQLTFRIAPDGIGYLDASVSLAKMLYGNNAQMVFETDLPRLIALISAFAEDVTGVQYDTWIANIGRLDVAHNFPVGEKLVQAYQHALHNAHYPRMVRNVIEGGTVKFTNRAGTHYPRPRITESVTVYSKLAEVLARASKGEEGKRTIWIAAHLTSHGVPLPSNWTRPGMTSQSVWNPSIVSRILGNTVYKGESRFRKRRVVREE